MAPKIWGLGVKFCSTLHGASKNRPFLVNRGRGFRICHPFFSPIIPSSHLYYNTCTLKLVAAMLLSDFPRPDPLTLPDPPDPSRRLNWPFVEYSSLVSGDCSYWLSILLLDDNDVHCISKLNFAAEKHCRCSHLAETIAADYRLCYWIWYCWTIGHSFRLWDQ